MCTYEQIIMAWPSHHDLTRVRTHYAYAPLCWAHALADHLVRQMVGQIPLRRGNLDMDARCAGAAAAIAILLLLP